MGQIRLSANVEVLFDTYMWLFCHFCCWVMPFYGCWHYCINLLHLVAFWIRKNTHQKVGPTNFGASVWPKSLNIWLHSLIPCAKRIRPQRFSPLLN